jgi:hypothetical protein
MIFEMTGKMVEFGRGYNLNDVVYIDDVRHECVRWTRQMKDGKEVVEFELIPMPEPIPPKTPMSCCSGAVIFADIGVTVVPGSLKPPHYEVPEETDEHDEDPCDEHDEDDNDDAPTDPHIDDDADNWADPNWK